MLTKPGIILGNAITTAGGFALASKGQFDFGLFALTMLGLCLVIACAGVFNNFLDRQADAKMERTKQRAFPQGLISSSQAIAFSLALGMAGLSILGYFTNALTVLMAIIGLFVYLVLYAFMKYRSFYGTLVGSIAGAIPPVIGYCAVSNRLDMGAVIIFMIVVLWQMPHFFAIAIYRMDDYAAASIPVLPVQKGIYATKIQMVVYICIFLLVALSPTWMGYTGFFYASIAALLGLGWLLLSLTGFTIKKGQDHVWAYRMFVYSLVVILGLSLTIPFDVVA